MGQLISGCFPKRSDHLSNNAVLMQILSYLPARDIQRCRLVNRRINMVIEKNKHRLAIPHAHLTLSRSTDSNDCTVIIQFFPSGISQTVRFLIFLDYVGMKGRRAGKFIKASKREGVQYGSDSIHEGGTYTHAIESGHDFLRSILLFALPKCNWQTLTLGNGKNDLSITNLQIIRDCFREVKSQLRVDEQHGAVTSILFSGLHRAIMRLTGFPILRAPEFYIGEFSMKIPPTDMPKYTAVTVSEYPQFYSCAQLVRMIQEWMRGTRRFSTFIVKTEKDAECFAITYRSWKTMFYSFPMIGFVRDMDTHHELGYIIGGIIGRAIDHEKLFFFVCNRKLHISSEPIKHRQ